MKHSAAIVGAVVVAALVFGTLGLLAAEQGSAAKEEATPRPRSMMTPGMMRGMPEGGMMGPQMMGGPMESMCPMCWKSMHMRGMGADAEKILLMSDKLRLSPEQKNQLSALKTEQKMKAIELRAELEKAQVKLEQLVEAEEIDLDAVRKAVGDVADARGKLEFAAIEDAVKASRLLNDEQRKKLKELTMMGMGPQMGSTAKGEGMMMREGSGMKPEGMMRQQEEGSGTRMR